MAAVATGRESDIRRWEKYFKKEINTKRKKKKIYEMSKKVKKCIECFTGKVEKLHKREEKV